MALRFLFILSLCSIELFAADFIAKIDKLDSFDFANAIDTPKLERRDKLDTPKLEQNDAIDTPKLARNDAIDTPKIARKDAIDTPKLERKDAIDAPKLETLNTEEFVFGFWFAGEKNPRFELSFDAREAMDALQIRLDYPDAWRLYKKGQIQDFSYFGFKLYDLECGLITEEEFLRELQDYLNKFGK